jgi:hypothetical protein
MSATGSQNEVVVNDPLDRAYWWASQAMTYLAMPGGDEEVHGTPWRLAEHALRESFTLFQALGRNDEIFEVGKRLAQVLSGYDDGTSENKLGELLDQDLDEWAKGEHPLTPIEALTTKAEGETSKTIGDVRSANVLG